MKQEDHSKLIAEIKEKLNGKSYFEINEILTEVQYDLMHNSIYQNPV